MTDQPGRKPVQVTRFQIFKWSLPALAGVLVNFASMVQGWEPWFGYAAIIAGGLGTLMYVGHSLGIGEG